MERWRNKVAIVTGACNGLGATCSIDLVKAGMIVAALGQQEQSMTELDLKLPEELKDRIHIMKCDVSNEQEVIKSFKWVSENLGPVHVLLCFAVTMNPMDLTGKYCTPKIKEIVDVNVNGIVYCVREGFNQMKEHEIDGHVVLLNSVAGHFIPKSSPLGSFNIVPATKFATTALTETYRQEFSNAGTNVKITSISPGVVDAGILPMRFKDMFDVSALKAPDISSAVLYCLSTPPHVQIQELMIKPLHEKF